LAVLGWRVVFFHKLRNKQARFSSEIHAIFNRNSSEIQLEQSSVAVYFFLYHSKKSICGFSSSLPCSLYSLFSILCSLFSVLYSLFSILCSLFSVLYSLFSILCSPFSVLYGLQIAKQKVHLTVFPFHSKAQAKPATSTFLTPFFSALIVGEIVSRLGGGWVVASKHT
jgi:hypothetical protein